MKDMFNIFHERRISTTMMNVKVSLITVTHCCLSQAPPVPPPPPLRADPVAVIEEEDEEDEKTKTAPKLKLSQKQRWKIRSHV
jgi:hypothetical protein